MNKDQLQARCEILKKVHSERVAVEAEIREIKSKIRGRPHNGDEWRLQRDLCVRCKPLATACYQILADMHGKKHTSDKICQVKAVRVEDFVRKLL